MGAMHGVLVTYCRPDDLEVMLTRLAEQQRCPDTLVVVDNDSLESGRPVVERHRQAHPCMFYLAAGGNTGPAGGISLGMQHILTYADPDDWIVLLDDDDPPRQPDDLRLLEELGTRLRSSDPKVAGIGASGTRFDVARARFRRVPDADLAGAIPSTYIAGNQLPLYSVHAVRSIGTFDEGLFFGLDDLEYGLRLWAAGFVVYAHGEIWYRNRAYHNRLGMEYPPKRTLDEPSWRRYYSLRNLIVILRRGGHPASAMRLVCRSIAKPLYNLPRNPLLAVRNLNLNTRAIRDAYLGRMGMTLQPAPKA